MKHKYRKVCFFLMIMAGCLLVVAADSPGAGTNNFIIQTLTLPTNTTHTIFVSLNKNKLSDLLALDPVDKKLFIFRQRATGFPGTPDEVIALPPRTTWIAPHDVEESPGDELLISTADGLFFSRQNGGKFEPELRTLIKTAQVFTNDDPPRLLEITNDYLPVISASQTMLYRRDEASRWTNAPATAFEFKRASVNTYVNEWTAGPNSSRSLHVLRSFHVESMETGLEKYENPRIKNLIEHLKKATDRYVPKQLELDLNRDGQKDLIVWQLFPGMETKIELYVFLRGADGKLPEQPSQTLRCRGFPMPVRRTEGDPSPVADLKGDGNYQIVLLEIKTALTSVSGVIDTVLSGGLDLALTVRPFRDGVFAANPVAAIPVKAIFPVTSFTPTPAAEEWPFFISGDFNGDGMLDLVVRRPQTQWDIYLSTNDRRWFAPQPAFTLEPPFEGHYEIKDLDGDGRSDLILRAKEGNRMAIFFTRASPQNRRSP